MLSRGGNYRILSGMLANIMNEECDARGTGLVEIEADIYYRAVMNVLIYQHGEGNK